MLRVVIGQWKISRRPTAMRSCFRSGCCALPMARLASSILAPWPSAWGRPRGAIMTSSERRFRQVALGSSNADAVTVGIETGTEGPPRAAVWWESKGDIDADEAEFDDVAA